MAAINRLIKITPDGNRRMISNMILSDGSGVAVVNDVIYVADIDNHIILKIVEGFNDPIVIAGARGQPGYVDAFGNEARFNRPSHMIADASGIIYVVDTGNQVIRKIKEYGEVTTLTGLLSQFPGDTIGNLAINPAGEIYTFDTLSVGTFPFTLFEEDFESYEAGSDFDGVNGFTSVLPLGLNEVFSNAPLALPIVNGEFLFRGLKHISNISLSKVGTFTITTDAAADGLQSLKLQVEPGHGNSAQIFGRGFNFDNLVNKVRITGDIRIERAIKGSGFGIVSFGEFFAGMVGLVGPNNTQNVGAGNFIFQNTETGRGRDLGLAYTLGTWYNISLEFDRILSVVNVFIDNIHRGEFPYKNKVDTLAMLQTFENDSESLMFVDNILIEQLA